MTSRFTVFFGGIAYVSWYKANVLDKVRVYPHCAAERTARQEHRLNLPSLPDMTLRSSLQTVLRSEKMKSCDSSSTTQKKYPGANIFAAMTRI